MAKNTRAVRNNKVITTMFDDNTVKLKSYIYSIQLVEFIPLTWDYCYIMSVSLTIPGRIN